MSASDGAYAEGSVCMPNIGPNERKKRMRFGVAFGVIGAVGAVAMAYTGVPRVARLALFVPFFISGIGVFQALEKT